MRTVPGILRVLASDEPTDVFDCYVWMLDLPGKLGTTLQNVPSRFPYLVAPADAAEVFARRVAEHPAQLRVGIAWAGNPRHLHDRHRSLPAEELSRLAGIEGVVFYQLHKLDRRHTAPTELPAGLALHDWTADFVDMSDTAGLIANLDLVVSVDTSVAHLVGAMGREVWTLLPFNAEHRWLTARDDTVWYPTMRLFRQRRPRDWTGVVQRIRNELLLKAHALC
jgi:hypothetical protein